MTNQFSLHLPNLASATFTSMRNTLVGKKRGKSRYKSLQ